MLINSKILRDALIVTLPMDYITEIDRFDIEAWLYIKHRTIDEYNSYLMGKMEMRAKQRITNGLPIKKPLTFN